jgi:uncharacterized protein
MLAACQGVHCPKIRIDSGERPCPGIRRTAKQEMVAYFASTQAGAAAAGKSAVADEATAEEEVS